MLLEERKLAYVSGWCEDYKVKVNVLIMRPDQPYELVFVKLSTDEAANMACDLLKARERVLTDKRNNG